MEPDIRRGVADRSCFTSRNVRYADRIRIDPVHRIETGYGRGKGDDLQGMGGDMPTGVKLRSAWPEAQDPVAVAAADEYADVGQ